MPYSGGSSGKNDKDGKEYNDNSQKRLFESDSCSFFMENLVICYSSNYVAYGDRVGSAGVPPALFLNAGGTPALPN